MDANIKYGPFNHDLINAILWLKGNGIVEKDKDLVDKMGYSKGTVSAYINGNKEASNDFREKFEEVFKLNLLDFQTKKELSKPANFLVSERDKYVALLEKTNDRQEADLTSLRKAVDGLDILGNRLNKLEPIVYDLSGKVEVAESNIEVLREWLIDQFSKMKKESPQSVAASMGRKREELLRKEKQRGTHAG
jgi:transcriptional regulator with XRE-family HTH domain